MKIQTQLSFSKIRFDQDTNAHLVVTITAPTKEGETARPSLCIVPVIDVSGSMGGAKLDYAKRSAIKLVEHLKTGDYCGLIVFDTYVRTIVKPHKLTSDSKEKLKAEIGKLQAGSSTNFAGGLLAALESIDQLDLPESVLQRVVMFTDGQANAGIATKGPDIIKLLTNAGRTTVSAFGYGADVDQDFLLAFSREGKGNYAAIANPDEALQAFGKELGGLLSTYATNLFLGFDPLAGHEITSVVSDVEAEQEAIGGNVTVKIPDILGEETRHLVFAVKLKEQKQAFPRAVNIFDIKMGYDLIDASGKKTRETAECKAKVSFVKPGEEDTKTEESLDQIIALAQIIRAQIEAEEAAKKGNFAAAQQVMANTARDLRGRGIEHHAMMADKIGTRLADNHVYTASAGYLRSVQTGGSRGMGAAKFAVEAEADLRGLGVVVENAVQANTASSFVDSGISVSANLSGYVNSPMTIPPIVNPSDTPKPSLWAGSLTGSSLQVPPPVSSPVAPPAPPPAPVQQKPAKAKTKPIKQAKSSRW